MKLIIFLSVFKDFLENVVEESKEFKDTDEVIKRYENLINIREELAKKHEKKTAESKRLTTDVFRRSKVILLIISIIEYLIIQ